MVVAAMHALADQVMRRLVLVAAIAALLIIATCWWLTSTLKEL